MKKIIAIICATTMIMSSFTTMGAITDGDTDGDVVNNPWKELFTTAAETTTPAENVTTPKTDVTTPSVDVTTPHTDETTPQGGETGKQNPNNGALNDAALDSAAATGSAVADAVGKYKIIVAQGNAEVVNIQEPGFATAPGAYVTFGDADFGDMTVNGVALSKDVQGAGVIMHLSNFEYKYSEVVVKSGNGSTKAVLHVYYEDGIDNVTGEVSTTPAVNETTKTDDTTTKNDDVTTKTDDSTTKAQDETTKGPSYDLGFNPADLEYTDVACTGDDTKDPLGFAATEDSNIEGMNPWYGDGGNTFMLQYADPNAEGPKATVTVNGQEPESGVIVERAQGLVKINPTKLADDSYTTVTVTLDSGKTATFVIKKGNPTDLPSETTKVEEKTDADVTTPAGDDATTKDGGSDVTTKAGDNPTEETTAKPYNPGFNPADLTYTDVACTGDDTKDPLGFAATEDSNIEGMNPWYGDGGNTFMLQYADPNAEGPKATVTVNGQEPESGVIVERAQGLVKINPTKLADDSYTTVTVTLDSGKTATFVIKKGNPTDLPSETTKVEDKTDANETTKEGDVDVTTKEGDVDVTTKAGDNPTEETTTANQYNPGFNPGELTYTDVECNGDDSKEAIHYAVKDGATLEGLNPWYGDGGNTFMLQFADENAEGKNANITINGEEPASGVIVEKAQGLVKVNPNMLADDTYNVVTVTLESGKTATFVIKKGNPADIVIETTTAKTEDDTTPGTDVTTKNGSDNPTTGNVDNPTTDNKETTTADRTTTKINDVTTSDTKDTTKAPEVTTTAKQGGTVATTVAPTGKTVVSAKVGKTKVKKATKKAAAKKIKVSLKKIGGAAGYQVRVFKAKKDAKKNKKAIVKKTIKKASATIKSKKLANKAKLFVRARAYKLIGGAKKFGKWSAVKKAKIK